MRTINMRGFENQKVKIIFAKKKYTIDLDAPTEIYRQFLDLPRPFKTDEDWDKVKGWIATLIGHYNDIDKKEFKNSLTKVAVSDFLTAYNEMITGLTGGSKKVKKPAKKKKKKS